MSQISLSKLTLYLRRMHVYCFVPQIVDISHVLNTSLNAGILMSICSRNKQQVLEKCLKELITGSACFMMHFYIFLTLP